MSLPRDARHPDPISKLKKKHWWVAQSTKSRHITTPGETLNTPPPPPHPHRALPAACFSCLLAHVFRPCLVLHRTMQHGSTCSSVQQKNMSNVFDLLEFFYSVPLSRFEVWTFWTWNMVLSTGTNSEDDTFLFYSNNSDSQKVKPFGRTTRFSAGLHCQTQKGRRTEFDAGY
jgi:hypothetical protein